MPPTKPNWYQPFAGYLFDLDGTLVDTAPDIHQALNVALQSFDHEVVTESHTRHWIGHGARKLIEEALLHQNNSLQHLDKMQEIFINHYAENICKHSVLYEGVRQSLLALAQRGAKLAVVTNKNTQLSIALLKAIEIYPFFNVVVCGDTLKTPKPAPDPAAHACEQLGLAAAEVLFVGDSITDVDCARAFGCAVVCVRDGYNHGTPADALGADGVIDSFTELV